MDPYQPPQADLHEPPRATPAGFRVAPVLVGGFVVDFLGSMTIGIVTGSVLMAQALARGVDPSQAAEAVAKQSSTGSALAVTMTLGFVLTLLGGYVAARWAAQRFLLHAAAAGSLSLALGLLLSGGTPGGAPAWLYYGSVAIQVPLAALGGKLAERRARRLARPTS